MALTGHRTPKNNCCSDISFTLCIFLFYKSVGSHLKWGADLRQKLANTDFTNFTHHNGVSFSVHHHFFSTARKNQQKYTDYNNRFHRGTGAKYFKSCNVKLA